MAAIGNQRTMMYSSEFGRPEGETRGAYEGGGSEATRSQVLGLHRMFINHQDGLLGSSRQRFSEPGHRDPKWDLNTLSTTPIGDPFDERKDHQFWVAQSVRSALCVVRRRANPNGIMIHFAVGVPPLGTNCVLAPDMKRFKYPCHRIMMYL